MLYATSILSVYEGLMTDRYSCLPSAPRAVMLMSLLVLGIGLAGCAGMSDGLTSAFADPSKYDSYDCKQLQVARKALAVRGAELQGLMAKADTGVAGSVVSEVAYRNDYLMNRGSSKLAEDVWKRNNCVAVPDKPGAAMSATPDAVDPIQQKKDAASSLIR
jgi:MFS family permease